MTQSISFDQIRSALATHVVKEKCIVERTLIRIAGSIIKELSKQESSEGKEIQALSNDDKERVMDFVSTTQRGPLQRLCHAFCLKRIAKKVEETELQSYAQCVQDGTEPTALKGSALYQIIHHTSHYKTKDVRLKKP